MPSPKTYSAKPKEVEQSWYLVDAKDQVLGRLAAAIAIRLRGKHKANFTPHTDTGDFIVVINASQVAVTGNKLKDKIYYSHSGYPGGIKATPLAAMQRRHPERVIRKAVQGMMPKNRLGRAMLGKLKIYPANEHPHSAQKPSPLKV